MESKEYLVFTHLNKLSNCDLTVGWAFILSYLKRHLAKKKMISIPFISDGSMYDVFSIFVKTDETGLIFKRPTYQICGKLEQFLDQEKTNAGWKTPPCQTSSIAHLPEGITITLMDIGGERMIRASFQGFQKKCIPQHETPVHKVQLKMKKDLYGHRQVYMVNEAITADSMEMHIVVGTSSRIFFVGETQPIMFGFHKYSISTRGQFLRKLWRMPDIRRIHWEPVVLDEESMRGPKSTL